MIGGYDRPENYSAGGRIQIAVGISAWSIAKISVGPFRSCSFSPSCFSIMVKMSAATGMSVLSIGRLPSGKVIVCSQNHRAIFPTLTPALDVLPVYHRFGYSNGEDGRPCSTSDRMGELLNCRTGSRSTSRERIRKI
jgi:hypothetical protein